MEPGTDHGTLLRDLSPTLIEGAFVFCSLLPGTELPEKEVVCCFREEEGMSVLLKKEIADHFHLEYSVVMAWITLEVYSSLEAIGLIAVVSSTLAAEEISCNTISAFHHDHIFVPMGKAMQTMEILNNLNA